MLDAFRQANDFPLWEMRDELEAFSSKKELYGTSVQLLLPETYMNDSGRAALKALQGSAEACEVVVIYDEIDLPLGGLKVSYDRGSGGHHGIDSLVTELKTKAFTRIRVGIAPVFNGVVRKPLAGDPMLSFLLKPFTPEEREVLGEVSKKVTTALEILMQKGRVEAMNFAN